MKATPISAPITPMERESLTAGEILLRTMEKSLETVRHVFGGSHRYYAEALEHYARALQALGDPQRAAEAVERAASIRNSTQSSPPIPAHAQWNSVVPRVLDAQGAARYLAVGLDTLYRLVRAGELPHSRVGKSIRFRPEDLDAYLTARVTREWKRVDRRGRPRQNSGESPVQS